jgi:hypothetical protein
MRAVRRGVKMKFRVALIVCVCPCLVVAGCGQKYSGGKRFPLSGKVTFNGEPIDLGSISFIPLENGQRVSGGTISDGAYAVPEAHGANAGKYRVEIRWQKKTGKKVRKQIDSAGTIVEDDVRAEGLPAEFNTDSTLTAEVSATHTRFDFHLKSDKRPARTVDDGVPEIYRNR